ncbi:polyisoprenyl-phosphate glycosyltransferase [Azospirillaceae bacterium]
MSPCYTMTALGFSCAAFSVFADETQVLERSMTALFRLSGSHRTRLLPNMPNRGFHGAVTGWFPRQEREQEPGPVLSVVVPFYNEGPGVEGLFERLLPTLDTLTINDIPVDWEVICVNDGSSDDTLERLVAMHRRRPKVRVLELSRNFGKEIALSAGLAFACGQAVVPMDADLQHPPELLPLFLNKWREGFDVVVATRNARVGQSFSQKMFARVFYWVFDHFSEVKLPREVGDFRLMDRKVVDVINQMPERTRFMKGVFAWVGFRQTSIPYDQGERATGNTKWSMWKLLRLSCDGLTAFSTFPLRVWGVVGAGVSGVAFLYILYRLTRTFLYGIDVPGYESLIVTSLFFGGLQLLILGIIGDYLGRVFNEVKGRPLFIVRAIHGYERAPVRKTRIPEETHVVPERGP